MEYEVEREYGQYHVRAAGQTTRGTTLTDGWLKQMGFWPLSRLNIQAAIDATYAMAGGTVLDPYAATHMPKDIERRPGFKSYPQHVTKGYLPRNNARVVTANAEHQRERTKQMRQRMHIPDRLLFKG